AAPALEDCQLPPPPDPPPQTTSWWPVQAVAIPPAGGMGAGAIARQTPCSAATCVAGRVVAGAVGGPEAADPEFTHPAAGSANRRKAGRTGPQPRRLLYPPSIRSMYDRASRLVGCSKR